jgi:hypothetical protein
VLDRHDLSCMRVIRFKHVVQQAPYICNLAGGELGSELCECVGGFVDECIDGELGVLVFHAADLKVVVFDFGVYSLDGGS